MTNFSEAIADCDAIADKKQQNYEIQYTTQFDEETEINAAQTYSQSQDVSKLLHHLNTEREETGYYDETNTSLSQSSDTTVVQDVEAFLLDTMGPVLPL